MFLCLFAYLGFRDFWSRDASLMGLCQARSVRQNAMEMHGTRIRLSQVNFKDKTSGRLSVDLVESAKRRLVVLKIRMKGLLPCL